jgi:hypothetical protein
MYSEYNPNPRGKRVGDCVIRAVSKATGKSWEETYIELCLLGYIMGDLPSSNAVWDNYLKTQGFIRDIVSADCPSCYTINDFCEEYPQGIYVIGTGSHAVAIENGCIFDTWQSGDEIPIYFYRKEE